MGDGSEMEEEDRAGGTASPASSYEAVVIGAGIGGLSCAPILGQEGMKVLVVEQHCRPGGYCTSFRRDGYTFDVAINSLSGCNPSGVIGSLLQDMGLSQEIEFFRLDPIKDLVFPEHRFCLPLRHEEYLSQLKRAFSSEAMGIEVLFETLEEIFAELKRIPLIFDRGARKGFSERYPFFTQYRSMALGKLLDRHLRDERLKALISGQCMYTGVSPARASVICIASMLLCYLRDGSYQVKGGVQRLADLLAKGFQGRGGHLLYSHRAEEILLEGGRVIGVRLGDGETIGTGVVISAADARQTFFHLLRSDDLIAEFRRQIQALRPPLSYFMVFLGVDLPLEKMDLCHHIDYFSTYDIESIFSRQRAGNLGKEAISIGMVIPTLIDPSLAPSGRHIVTISLLVPYGWPVHWDSVKDDVADYLIRVAEEIIPDPSSHIHLQEVCTPLTLERYTSNFQGAAYGWEQSPDQAGPRRLSPRTPIQNLYLAGHWTYPGGGVASVAVSGRIVAQEVLGSRG